MVSSLFIPLNSIIFQDMWNWSIVKSVVFGVIVGIVLFLSGLPLKTTVVIGMAFVIFAEWIIREINFVREAHGSNIEELEGEIEELKEKVKKLH